MVFCVRDFREYSRSVIHFHYLISRMKKSNCGKCIYFTARITLCATTISQSTITFSHIMLLQFRQSQIGRSENHPLPYTASPISLLWDDLLLGLRCFRYVPGILLPLRPWRPSSRNELRGTRENLIILVIHIALIIGQLGFIVSLLFCVMLPMMTFVTYFMGGMLVNFAICTYLNGRNSHLISQSVKQHSAPAHEYWVFINGVAAG